MRVLVDAPVEPDFGVDFDAGVIASVGADFAWPEPGDPAVRFEVERDPGGPLPELGERAAYVFARRVD